ENTHPNPFARKNSITLIIRQVILTGNHQISFFLNLSNRQTKGIAIEVEKPQYVDRAWIAALNTMQISHSSKTRMPSGLYTSVTKEISHKRAVKIF
ncbi:MAG: hypothetical protein K2Z81_10300, partial [Cyanobacteria bacterium]|nr:hypothetical protein [Cyanobacteriota bacterium]